ncbi:glyoxylate/hydroxypyruvate reductase B-like [Megalops cyprinoides]|uniref:glyoxylate/hydroxypyruvate reductase B-like n=1 Tax=Megalops cyprinoides TaxID=118141 RepID=UPI001864391E|nr:glyoxylate/hydroxypyruvate reductase B-like [Megalops cyprinoides]
MEKPWALISEVGGDNGYLEELAAIVKERFRTVCHRELLQNRELYADKIQALFIWKYCPAPEPTLLRSLPALKVIASGGVGTDHLDLPLIASLGVKVANTPCVVSDATADIAMALLLASARKIVEGHKIAVAPETTRIPQSLMGSEVTGATLGIIGMGEIGYKVAQRSRGFDMQVLYHNRTRRSTEDEQAVGAHYCERLEELLRRSDFVLLSVTLTARTRGLIGRRELGLMKPTATLINISRGLVVDQDALVEALQNKTIHAAALDVTYPEPLPRDHPLLSLPNVLITPHIGINTHQTARNMVQRMVGNAVAALNGLPIPDEVKPK